MPVEQKQQSFAPTAADASHPLCFFRTTIDQSKSYFRGNYFFLILLWKVKAISKLTKKQRLNLKNASSSTSRTLGAEGKQRLELCYVNYSCWFENTGNDWEIERGRQVETHFSSPDKIQLLSNSRKVPGGFGIPPTTALSSPLAFPCSLRLLKHTR